MANLHYQLILLTKLSFYTLHRHSTTVSKETYPLYLTSKYTSLQFAFIEEQEPRIWTRPGESPIKIGGIFWCFYEILQPGSYESIFPQCGLPHIYTALAFLLPFFGLCFSSSEHFYSRTIIDYLSTDLLEKTTKLVTWNIESDTLYLTLAFSSTSAYADFLYQGCGVSNFLSM